MGNKDAGEEYDIKDIEPVIASEMFEQVHFLYGTQSVEETVKIMKEMGLEKIARKAIDS